MHVRCTTWQCRIAFGGARIKLLPLQIVMVDRADGTEWTLTHSAERTHVGITDDPPHRKGQGHFFGPFDGPHIHLPERRVQLRLFIRDARLGYEVRPYIPLIDEGRVLTRRGTKKFSLEIVIPASWSKEGDNIAWTEGFSG